MSDSSDLNGIAVLCEALYNHASAMDILALYTPISGLLQIGLRFVDNIDWENIGMWATDFFNHLFFLCIILVLL